ncbi:MAG: DUF4402 domain-containing protein [Bacteroidales bacterium]|nr:DUF4402 domain-containing protein [Bacteroidales bacterium]
MARLKIYCYSLLIALLLSGVRVSAQGTNSISVTGQIFAEVIPVFSASETSRLNFGRFSPGPQGGKIILTPQSTISVIGSIYKGTGTHNAASFYITGDEDAAYSITLPSSPVVLNHTRSAKTMVIEEWNSVPAPGVGTGMLRDGFQVVYVGATLRVGTLHDNPVGVYTGSYTVTFDFN